MAMAVKKIRFEYFQFYCKYIDQDRNEMSYLLFDIEPILQQAQLLDITKRTYRYYDEESRLQTVYQKNINKDISVWGMQFLRIRKNVIPGIATEDGEYELLNLADDEYIGEEVTALYDPQYCVMMLQRNKDSLSPTGIQSFFNEAWAENEIELRAVILPEHYMQFKTSDIFRGITIKFADIKKSKMYGQSALMSLLRAVADFEGINAELKISLGQKGKRGQTLKPKQMLAAINDFKNRGDVTKLEIKKKENEYAKVEVFDLIEHRLHEYSSFKFSREEAIGHERVFDQMIKLYLERRPTFSNILRAKE